MPYLWMKSARLSPDWASSILAPIDVADRKYCLPRIRPAGSLRAWVARNTLIARRAYRNDLSRMSHAFPLSSFILHPFVFGLPLPACPTPFAFILHPSYFILHTFDIDLSPHNLHRVFKNARSFPQNPLCRSPHGVLGGFVLNIFHRRFAIDARQHQSAQV